MDLPVGTVCGVIGASGIMDARTPDLPPSRYSFVISMMLIMPIGMGSGMFLFSSAAYGAVIMAFNGRAESGQRKAIRLESFRMSLRVFNCTSLKLWEPVFVYPLQAAQVSP